jgi:hypothetical protein
MLRITDYDSRMDAMTAELLDTESPPWQGEPWPLRPGEPLGQTWRTRADGLCAVEVLLAVEGEGTTLDCHVQEDGPDGRPLGAWAVAVAADSSQRYTRISLPPVANSAGRRFYVWFEVRGEGVACYTTDLARLGDGTAYRAHVPVEGCLAFRTFALEADARLAERRQTEALLARQSELTRDLVAARAEIDRLLAERAGLVARLTDLRARLAPPASAEGRAGG